MRIRRLLAATPLGILVACAGLALFTPDARAEVVQGRILYLGADGNSVNIHNKNYTISEGAKILISGKPASVSDLKPRMNCKVTLAHAEARKFVCTRK